MAGGVPTPALLIIATAIESVIIVKFLPNYLEGGALLPILLPLLAINYCVVAFYNVLIYPFFVTPLRHLPQPKGAYPILGHGLSMFTRPPGADFARWMSEVPNDGLIYFRGFFNTNRLLVTDPKVIGEILVTKAYDFEKPPPMRRFLRRILGDGLIIVEGDQHRFLRKTMLPSFSFRHIKELYSVFWDKAVQLSEGVAQQIAENPDFSEEKTANPSAVVEINHWANQVTMDIIGLAAIGTDFQALKHGDDPLIVNYEELLDPTITKQIFFAANLLAPPALIERLPWRENTRLNAITKNLTEICLKLVADKKEAMKTNPDDHKDILSHLIRTDSFSDEQMVDQILTFLAAGHETTSSAVTWTTYLLATHPEIQRALREEVRANVPSPGAPVPVDTDLATILESLPLLNGVCNEVLRLYPTVPLTVRTPLQDRELAGQFIPKGTEIILVPAAINRLPSLWGPQADKFVPERWIDTDPKTGERRPNQSGGAPSNYAILTFLHGPRSCIGQGFAKAELRALVAAFIGGFEMEMANPDEEVIISGVITTKPKNGMHLRLKHLGAW